MKIFDTVKKTTIASRRLEEELYGIALDEVENNKIRKGLYAKALAKSDGNKEKADGIYLRLRVQSIMDAIESDEIDKREDASAYKAIQAYRKFESIEVVKEAPDALLKECKELLGMKGYSLKTKDTGEYIIGNKNDSIYSSFDLNDIKNKALKLSRAT